MLLKERQSSTQTNNWLEKLLANRNVTMDFLSKSLKDLTSPLLLPDMEQAALLAISHQFNHIVCVVDYDTDGISSGAVLKQGLRGLGFTNVEILVTDRHAHGYGFSEGVVETINKMGHQPSLIITADLGSSDGERLAKLNHIPIIVTDHHHISETTPPKNIQAFVNPHRSDIEHHYHHPVCGAMVAWNLIAAIRAVAKKRESVKIKTDFDIKTLLDYVAVATIGDMVSLKDHINRVVTQYGLMLIDQNSRPAWQALRVGIGDKPIREDVVGFQISPRINAMSRMGDNAQTALDFLVSEDMQEATSLLGRMNNVNEDRKDEQAHCEALAMMQAKEQIENGQFVCVCYVPDAGHGVVGLAAGKIVSKYGVPAIVLSVNHHGEATGSGRSIAGYDLRDALVRVQNKTGIMKKYGGHAMAAGLTLNHSDHVQTLLTELDAIVKSDFNNEKPQPTLWHDGLLSKELTKIDEYRKMMSLGPFGQEFPAPTFLLDTPILSMNTRGDKNQHLFIKTSYGDLVWFNHDFDLESKHFKGVVSLNENSWNGNVKIQMMVLGIS